jgi:hypothetical protein
MPLVATRLYTSIATSLVETTMGVADVMVVTVMLTEQQLPTLQIDDRNIAVANITSTEIIEDDGGNSTIATQLTSSTTGDCGDESEPALDRDVPIDWHP